MVPIPLPAPSGCQEVPGGVLGDLRHPAQVCSIPSRKVSSPLSAFPWLWASPSHLQPHPIPSPLHSSEGSLSPSSSPSHPIPFPTLTPSSSRCYPYPCVIPIPILILCPFSSPSHSIPIPSLSHPNTHPHPILILIPHLIPSCPTSSQSHPNPHPHSIPPHPSGQEGAQESRLGRGQRGARRAPQRCQGRDK